MKLGKRKAKNIKLKLLKEAYSLNPEESGTKRLKI
jgi:hypothetical protein